MKTDLGVSPKGGIESSVPIEIDGSGGLRRLAMNAFHPIVVWRWPLIGHRG